MHDYTRPCTWPALLALALCGSPAHGAPEKMKVDPSKVQTALFLREGPAESSRALGKLAPGTAVIALGPKENGFLKLSTPGGQGWSSAAYLASAARGPAGYDLPASKPGAPNRVGLLGVTSDSGDRPAQPGSPSGTITGAATAPGATPGDGISGNPLGEASSAVISPFGPRPWIVGPGSRVHGGVDIRTKEAPGAKKPVVALGDGEVELAGPGGAGGLTIKIRHDDGHRTAYCHLSTLGETRKGMRVKKGQKIGVTGNTGRTSGPHLHFEICDKNSTRKLDPLGFGPVGRTFTVSTADAARWTRGGWKDPR